MKTTTLIQWVLIGASLPFFAGCVERRVVYRDRPVVVAPAPGPPTVVEDYPPAPPPRVEVIAPVPGPPAVWYWAPGVWEWRGRWVWTSGRWMSRPHPGAVWVGAHWGFDRYHHRVWMGGVWR